jgi:restriction endonuclease S subunit
MNPTGKKAPRFLQQWDIIFSGRGTKVFATTVDVQPVKTVASPQFFVIRPQDPRNARYITWYINAYSGQRYLWRNAGGSAILNVKKEVLENLPLPLPSEKDLPAVTDYINAMETEKKFHAALQQERQRMLEGIISKSMEA